jgi:hypothetical protein
MIISYSSDIMPNCTDMRTKFGYNMLYAIKFNFLKTEFSLIHKRTSSD